MRAAVGRNETLALLREHKLVLAERYGVVDLALFGSTARDEAGPDSDVDVLVTFKRPLRSRQYFGAWHYLEDLLGRPIDLVTDRELRVNCDPPSRQRRYMSERRWAIYVRDMIECCDRILRHTGGLDREMVFTTDIVRDATLWNIGVLGEAANRIPEAVREAHHEIPWRDMIDARNRIIHGYGDIDDDVLWDIISRDIPELLPSLRALVEKGG